MILVRSPLRISIAGGGTDLASYCHAHGGHWISAAIDKYVYVTVMRPFQPGIYLKYSQLEKVQTVDEVQHPILREALKLMGLTTPQIEITTLADIPAGTGLGSSSAFTVALLKALYVHRRMSITTEELAKLACELEINHLGQPIGFQDQYISAYGGLTSFYSDPHDHTKIYSYPLNISFETMQQLEENLLLFFTGFTRNANDILQEQNQKSLAMDHAMLHNLTQVKRMASETEICLARGDLDGYGEILKEHWRIKKQRSAKMSNPQIDQWHDDALQNGARGLKLIGAGGGGFLLALAKDKAKLQHAMRKNGLEEVSFKFDFEGTRLL